MSYSHSFAIRAPTRSPPIAAHEHGRRSLLQQADESLSNKNEDATTMQGPMPARTIAAVGGESM